MDGCDQAKPLAPVAAYCSEELDATSAQFSRRQRNYLKGFGCVLAIVLILAVLCLVLSFTVFQVKDPKITMNGVTVTHLMFNNNGTLRQDVNVTLHADVTIKNPKTTTIYYNGSFVGEGHMPGGKAPAHRTLRMNMTLDIIPAKLMEARTMLPTGQASGALKVESHANVRGRVKIVRMIKKTGGEDELHDRV